MSPEIPRAKEIKEAISNKAGVTEAEVWVFDLQKDDENGEEYEENEAGTNAE